MRKLATLRVVSGIAPIDGADKIEIAFIDGWQCVVKKGQFKSGDLGVYFEIDSFLPLKPEYEFLKNCLKTMADGTKGYRLKTITLRGQLSQGLLLRLEDVGLQNTFSIGDDLTDILGVIKYEAPVPACISGEAKGMLPGRIRTTDQERIQNLPEYFEKYKDEYFEESEKLDGTSCSVYFMDGDTGVCGRTIDFKENDKNSFWKEVKKLDLLNKMIKYGRNIAIQGELIGEGIQKNKYKIIGQSLRVFDIWDIDNQCYFSAEERLSILNDLGICYVNNHVPILRKSYKVFEEYRTMNELLSHADGDSILGHTIREGIVLKSVKKINGRIISFKVISNKFLPGNED